MQTAIQIRIIVARWDGASWHSVGSGNPGAGGGALSSAVLALAVDGTDSVRGRLVLRHL